MAALYVRKNKLISRRVPALPYSGGHVTLFKDKIDVKDDSVLLQEQPVYIARPWTLVSVIEWNRTKKRYIKKRVPGHLLVHIFLSTLLRSDPLYDSNQTYFTRVESQRGEKRRSTCETATRPVSIRIWRCTMDRAWKTKWQTRSKAYRQRALTQQNWKTTSRFWSLKHQIRKTRRVPYWLARVQNFTRCNGTNRYG